MIRFGFKIRTRSGTVVDTLTIMARDRAEAERRVNQVYYRCEILECHELEPEVREEAFDFESAINLISRERPQPPPES